MPIAILTMVFLDFLVTDTYTQKVKVPNGFEPSSPDLRGWLINPMGMREPFNMWVALGALGPALLLFILVKEQFNTNSLVFYVQSVIKSILNFVVDIYEPTDMRTFGELERKKINERVWLSL